MVFHESELFNWTFAGNTGTEYATALAIFVTLTVVMHLFKFTIIETLKKLAEKTHTDFDDVLIAVVDSIRWGFYLFFALYFSIKWLTVPQWLTDSLNVALLVVLAYYAVKATQEIITFYEKRTIKKRLKKDKNDDTTKVTTIAMFARWSLWFVAALLLMSNLGYDITALIAGLGIGGLAVALAAQNVLSDIFASFSIYFDKPFRVGDFIILGNDKGIVKKIGIKTTRLTTLQGEELIVSNQELTGTRIHNYKKMKKRRIVFTLGVTYDTPVKKLEKIPLLIKKAVGNMKLATPDRIHFKSFGDFSLNFEVVYFLDSPDYAVYMDTQQKINLEIKRAFEKEKIEMAFPTQTVHVVR
ncbi:MAG: mechanosensitive ion channel family protein [Candidatus Micrarchaeia archaeon]